MLCFFANKYYHVNLKARLGLGVRSFTPLTVDTAQFATLKRAQSAYVRVILETSLAQCHWTLHYSQLNAWSCLHGLSQHVPRQLILSQSPLGPSRLLFNLRPLYVAPGSPAHPSSIRTWDSRVHPSPHVCRPLR